MPDTVIPAPAPTLLPVAGTEARFPVRRVYCVGRNYAAHAVEMGHDPRSEPPFFFQKNPDNLDPSGVFPYPARSKDVHHEVELLVALKAGGDDIAPEAALDTVYGYAVSIDMTRRDLQGEAKKAGRPWEVGKAVERSAPVGPIHPVEVVGRPDSGAITLSVNGEMRQAGDLSELVWSVGEIISTLSQFFTLAAGDVILTGTPAGVGPVARSDVMRAEIAGLGALDVRVD